MGFPTVLCIDDLPQVLELRKAVLSAYSQMPVRILWLVDEYVLKSEPPEGLAQIIERATRPYWLAPRSNNGGKHPSAGHRDTSEVVKRQGAVA